MKFKQIRYILSSTIFLYVIAGVFIYCFTSYQRAWNHVVPTVLSRYMPTPQYWVDFNRDHNKLEIKKMKEFERYYQKVSQLMPFIPHVHGMAGYCFFYDSQIAKAKKSYEEAIDVDPKVFNFYYNLGLIYLKEKNLTSALEYFKKSVAVSPVENIEHIITAKIYQPFFPYAHQPQVLANAMGEYTKEYYRQAYLQILEICEIKKDYKTMLLYARQTIQSGILESKIAYYYAGRASYQLKEFQNSTVYLQEAISRGFVYAQAFEMLGASLKSLGRPQGAQVFVAAASLIKDGKIFTPEKLKDELLVY